MFHPFLQGFNRAIWILSWLTLGALTVALGSLVYLSWGWVPEPSHSPRIIQDDEAIIDWIKRIEGNNTTPLPNEYQGIKILCVSGPYSSTLYSSGYNLEHTRRLGLRHHGDIAITGLDENQKEIFVLFGRFLGRPATPTDGCRTL